MQFLLSEEEYNKLKADASHGAVSQAQQYEGRKVVLDQDLHAMFNRSKMEVVTHPDFMIGKMLHINIKANDIPPELMHFLKSNKCLKNES